MSDPTTVPPGVAENSEGEATEASHELWLVKVLHSSETELCRPPEEVEIARGDLVVVPTKYGKDFGRVLGPIQPGNGEPWDAIKQIHRIASDSDRARYEENERRAQEALGVCREKVIEHHLDMTLVSAHFLLEEPKILFFFTADGRVDFRNLVKDLVAVFRMRIELRQIGVRDESRVLGGLGVCGRVLCCHGMTDKLKPVSIKMAKLQNLSLNSIKISGPCGRLLCCLAYEHDFYRDARKSLPSEGNRISYEGTVFKVTEVNVVSRQIRLQGDDGRYLMLPACRISFDSGTQRWRIMEEAPCDQDA